MTDLRGLQRVATAQRTQRILELRIMRDRMMHASRNLPTRQSRQAAGANADTLSWALAELDKKGPKA